MSVDLSAPTPADGVINGLRNRFKIWGGLRGPSGQPPQQAKVPLLPDSDIDQFALVSGRLVPHSSKFSKPEAQVSLGSTAADPFVLDNTDYQMSLRVSLDDARATPAEAMSHRLLKFVG